MGFDLIVAKFPLKDTPYVEISKFNKGRYSDGKVFSNIVNSCEVITYSEDCDFYRPNSLGAFISIM
jgi:hypothetical protein